MIRVTCNLTLPSLCIQTADVFVHVVMLLSLWSRKWAESTHRMVVFLQDTAGFVACVKSAPSFPHCSSFPSCCHDFSAHMWTVSLSAALLSQTMQAARCPTDELSLTNCAVVSEKDLQSGQWVVVIAYPSLHSTIWAPLQSFSHPPKHSLIHPPHLLPSIHAVTVNNLMSGCRVWLSSLLNGIE